MLEIQNFQVGLTPANYDTLPIGVTNEMYDVKKYGGFYIARYEAGIPEGETSPSNKTGIPVSKKGTISWSNIDYTNAKASAESMISNQYVQTGLLTGEAWDTTCHWIEDYIKTLDAESSLTNSKYYGNYYNITFKYINLSNEEVEKKIDSKVKIPTGSTEYSKTKNIYDLAGNVSEWTNCKYGSNCFYRGGGYRGGTDYRCVSYYISLPASFNDDGYGFRTRLYIK